MKRRGPLLTPRGRRYAVIVTALALVAFTSWFGFQNADSQGQRASRIFFENLNEE